MQALVEIGELPARALDAAALFHDRHLPAIRDAVAGGASSVALVFPIAGADHESWRKAALADLAREAAPVRVNGVSGADGFAVRQCLDWLAGAQGITGQFLAATGANSRNQAE